MKGGHTKIYIATKGQNLAEPDKNDFNILLVNPPKDGKMYKSYVMECVVLEMLGKLREVCGGRAMRYVDKQIKQIKGEE